MREIKSGIIKKAGALLVVLCFWYIGRTLWRIDFDWSVLVSNPYHLFLFLLLGPVGAGLLYLVAGSWADILNYIEPRPVSRRELSAVYIRANIAKYLPGNVMNLIGRNVMAGRLGFAQKNIAMSTVLEIILFACTTLTLAVLLSLGEIRRILVAFRTYGSGRLLLLEIAAGLTVLTGAGVLIRRNRARFQMICERFCNLDFVRVCIRAAGSYSIYFVSCGVMLGLLLCVMLNDRLSAGDFLSVAGIYILSFFLGYITPGAPGGMGVREAVLLLLLTPIVGNEHAVVASVLHRILTVYSDVVIYLACTKRIKGLPKETAG